MNDPMPERPGPDATREEWAAAADAYAAWSARQADGSRGGALANVTLLDLEQPLRRFLTQEELERSIELVIAMQQTLVEEGHGAAQTFVAATLRAALEQEAAVRHNQLEHARIMLEANGHEVSVVKDGVGWYPLCYCETPEFEAFTPSAGREPAVAAAAAHAAEHDGAWSALTD